LERWPKRVLVVEDDADTRGLIVDILAEEGLEVRSCVDGLQALELLRSEPFDLVLADIKMPRLTGIDLLFEIRRLGLPTRCILMTAYASVETAVQALRGHAFDYLIKPFTLRDLRERVSKALEIPEPGPRLHRVIRYQDIVLDEDAHKVWRGDRVVTLTPREFGALAYLIKCAGRTVSTEELREHAWRQAGAEERSAATVKSTIFRLRREIEDNPHEPRYIRSVWGVGYQFGE